MESGTAAPPRPVTERVSAPPFIAAVVGPPGSGKTSLLLRVADALRARGARLGGVVQPAMEGSSGMRAGYRLRDIATGEEIAFAQRSEHGFDFSEEGWRFARDRVAAALRSADCLVLDELGRLEARGEGHLAALELPERPPAMLVAVRENCAEAVAARLGSFSLRLNADADAPAIDGFIAALQARLRAAPHASAATERTP